MCRPREAPLGLCAACTGTPATRPSSRPVAPPSPGLGPGLSDALCSHTSHFCGKCFPQTFPDAPGWASSPPEVTSEPGHLGDRGRVPTSSSCADPTPMLRLLPWAPSSPEAPDRPRPSSAIPKPLPCFPLEAPLQRHLLGTHPPALQGLTSLVSFVTASLCPWPQSGHCCGSGQLLSSVHVPQTHVPTRRPPTSPCGGLWSCEVSTWVSPVVPQMRSWPRTPSSDPKWLSESAQETARVPSAHSQA